MIHGKHNSGPVETGVLFRFCLYGFLKNQRYFEPFMILVFLEKGFSFFQMGLLMGFRELCINIFEIPSGAIADLYGRRRSMVFSFFCYTISFLIFALSDTIGHFFIAMFFFGTGEAFRSGTHKAIIFEYLRERGQEDQRLWIYGFTRSWSQIGSALSALIAAALVFWTGRYSDIFWLCAIPSTINIINFLGYPPQTEEHRQKNISLRGVFIHVFDSLREAWQNQSQRRLLLESSVFNGIFKITKDYVQIMIKSAALALPFLASMPFEKRTAIMIGVIYSGIYLLAGFAARNTWRVSKWKGSEDLAAMAVWLFTAVLYGLLIPALGYELHGIAIVFFVMLFLMQNIWRPLLCSRINASCPAPQAATTLSIESQLKSLVAMVVAPLLGLVIDHMGLSAVGVIGLVICLVFWLLGKSLSSFR